VKATSLVRVSPIPSAAAGTCAEAGVTVVPAPADALSETVASIIGTVRRECLDHLLIVGCQDLAGVVRCYLEHYNQRRPHRGLVTRRRCHWRAIAVAGCSWQGP
jgi:hypothetical protein